MLNIESKDTILRATINRPKAKNAINFEVMEHLENLLERLEHEKSIHAFIFTGAGDNLFISGGDLKEFHTLTSAEEAEQMARRMGSILKRIEKLPCWTVAAINGATYGGGWEIMLAFDFRIASSNAVFHFSQGKFYLPPGWGGLTRLVEKVGRSTALRWLAETAEIDAETALKRNLIDRTTPGNELQEEAEQWALKMSQNGRDYIKALKRGALKCSQTRWRAIEEELEPFAQFWEDERHQQRVKKFLDRNKQN
ncbi:MAG: enoyl-CoA hydratase/isomerase family protein [Balneolaceae bacterium]|nr:enoyl-CoA hydratase/isomerase family protein [Balneolaceae bacterium]